MKLISYATKTGLAAENRSKIEAVFTALHEMQLPGFSYLVVETAEGEFLHIVEAEADALAAFRTMPAFLEFSGSVPARQTTPAVTSEVKIVGSFGNLVQA